MKLFSDRYKRKYKGEIGGGISNPYEQKWANPLNQYKDPTQQWKDAQSGASSTQNMSMATNQSKAPIQGSGYSSAYASNPTNYKPQTAKPYQPTPQQQYQAPPAPSATSLTNQYLAQRGQSATDRIAGLQDRAKGQIDLQQQLYDSRNKTLGNIGNIQKESFGNYADQLRQGLGLQQQTAQRQQGEAQQLYDESKYYNEQARKERMKGLEGTLASLGTLQSSALGNIGAKINMGAERQDRSAQRELSSRVADIQDQYRLAENQTEGLIQQEADRYRQQVELLAGQMDTNSLEFRQAVSEIANKAEDNINSILDSFDNFAYNANLEMIKAQTPDAGAGSDLRTELFNRAKETGFSDVQNAYSRIMNSQPNSYGDIAKITSFMKLLDPGSVVREGEFKTAADAAGVLQSTYGIPLQVTGQGLLTPESRRQLEAAATNTYDAAVSNFEPVVNYYAQIAQQQGIDPYSVIGEYSFFDTSGYQNQAGQQGLESFIEG